MSDTDNDNYDITTEVCEYDGCDKKVTVCACCEDKNNLKYHFICDRCRRLYCLRHKYYTYNTCHQNQTWDTMCRECVSTYFISYYKRINKIKFYEKSGPEYEGETVDVCLCTNYLECGGISETGFIHNKCDECIF